MVKPSSILIFGATSAIAYETSKLFAKDGASLYLCARDESDLKRLADDLKVRGAKDVCYSVFDALDDISGISAIDKCLKKFPELDGVLIAHGSLPDQKVCEANPDEARKAIQINFTSSAVLVNYIANHFEKRGRGTIAVISSVAGDRGRQSNYVYGSAKGALTVFLDGLRHRLYRSGVKVVTIKPGFVDTPMTVNYEKGLLFAKPDTVAKGIHEAMLNGRAVVYLPWFWRWIMFVIRNIPPVIFNKTRL